MLAMDGGGIRGVISLQVLRSPESQLRERFAAGPDVRLRQYFDYIAGKSTGAILAAGLWRGMSVDDLEAFCVAFGEDPFDPQGSASPAMVVE
jgi:patatin-like phospholipase/acyl hydrolase